MVTVMVEKDDGEEVALVIMSVVMVVVVLKMWSRWRR